MKQAHLIISGDVQGVGYRAWAHKQAKQLGLTGWVKNKSDGAVELVAQGNRANLEEFVKRCNHGPDVAWVRHVDVSWEEAQSDCVSFEVIY